MNVSTSTGFPGNPTFRWQRPQCGRQFKLLTSEKGADLAVVALFELPKQLVVHGTGNKTPIGLHSTQIKCLRIRTTLPRGQARTVSPKSPDSGAIPYSIFSRFPCRVRRRLHFAWLYSKARRTGRFGHKSEERKGVLTKWTGVNGVNESCPWYTRPRS